MRLFPRVIHEQPVFPFQVVDKKQHDVQPVIDDTLGKHGHNWYREMDDSLIVLFLFPTDQCEYLLDQRPILHRYKLKFRLGLILPSV